MLAALRSSSRSLAVACTIAAMCAQAAAQSPANGPYYAPPSWSQTLPGFMRFIVLPNFGSQAVLDRETGLVWERTPSTTLLDGAVPQNTFGGPSALQHCVGLIVGNRMGWRLPSIQELLSLVDRTAAAPALPAGHPFVLNLTATANDDANKFWSATSYANGFDSPALRTVNFYSGQHGSTGTGGAFTFRAWCVRTGSGNPIQ